jgi:hypothetical protein
MHIEHCGDERRGHDKQNFLPAFTTYVHARVPRRVSLTKNLAYLLEGRVWSEVTGLRRVRACQLGIR